MRKRSLVLALGLLCVLPIALKTFAANGKAKKLNSQLFEKETEGSVSGKVKVIREIQEETEVFLDVQKGSGGPYALPANTKNRAGFLKILQKSQKARGPSVTLTIDDQQRISDVVEHESAPASSGENWEL